MSKKNLCLANKYLALIALIGSTGMCGCGVVKQTVGNTTTAKATGNSSASLSLSPASASVATGQGMLFISPFGPFPVQWSVNGVVGGNSVFGIVDDKGAYTAPLVTPKNSVTLEANLADASENPDALTASAAIRVVNPVPAITQLSTNAIPVGSAQDKITVTGTGFNPNSSVAFNDLVAATSFVDDSHLTVQLPTAFSSTAGVWTLTVSNATPGGGVSAPSTIEVLNPEPGLDAVSPAVAFAGTGPMTVTLFGAGYVPQSSVLVNGQVVPSIWNGNGTLTIQVPSGLLASPGQLSLTVTNAAPGGGSSLAQLMTILPNGQVANTGNPQVASYSLTIPDGSRATVGFGEEDYSLNTSAVAAPSGGGQVRVLVAGMKPNIEYHMRAILQMADGSTAMDIDHTFDSGSLPASTLPSITVTRTGLGSESRGVQFFNNTGFPGQYFLFAADHDGNIIWTYNHSTSEFYFPAKLTDDGNLLALVNPNDVLREFNLAGETGFEFGINDINAAVAAAGYSVQLLGLHHDFQKLKNGHYLLLTNTSKSVVREGSNVPTQVTGDVIIDLDPNFKVAWLWNSFDHLDVNRYPVDPIDWTHSNSIQYLPKDGNLLLSMRHQSWVLKIDYQNGTGTGDILWRLGWQGDFTLAGAPSEWFYLQHYINVLGDDGTHMRIALFDNGDNRILDLQGEECGMPEQVACYSRALILDVDEGVRSAAVEFESSLGLYSYWGGSAQLAANGNFFAGITVTYSGSRAEEITTGTPSELVWQMDVLGQNAYRSLRIPSLYPNVEWP